MTSGKLLSLVLQNANRHRREFILSGFGIAVGVAAFVFFMALSVGVKNKVVEIFPEERVEVIAPRAVLLTVDVTKRIDDEAVEAIKKQSVVGVRSVVPRMAIDFPVAVEGYFGETRLAMDMVGDGVDPGYVQEDDIPDLFKDWEAEDTPLKECTRVMRGSQQKLTCEGLYYCDRRDMKCHHRVPVIISNTLVELYNSQFAKSRGLPSVGKFAKFLAERGGLAKMRLYIDLGKSAVSMSNKPLLSKPRSVEGVVLGISNRAIPIGATVPMGYVKRWNLEFAGEEAATAYSSLIVDLEDKEDVAPFGKWLMDELNLRLEDSLGERFASIITIITLIFLIIALVIVMISAINIAHSFFMQVAERRREIGLLRAIGATQANIRMLFVGEAALLGLIAGVIGVLVGYGIILIGDWAFVNHTADFAFKPETLFDFQLWIPCSGLGLAILFGVLGGILPATKAAKMQPAEALSS